MPRYFFDFEEDGETTLDEAGIDLLDDHAAKLQASITLTDIARDEVPADGPTRSFAVHVRRDGQPLFTSTMDYSLRSDGTTRPPSRYPAKAKRP